MALSVGAVTWYVLSRATNSLVHRLFSGRFRDNGGTDEPAILALLLTAGLLGSGGAGYLCGMLARERESTVALQLGLALLGLGLWLELGRWDDRPLWFHVAALGLIVPAVVLGGWARSLQGRDL